MKFNSIGILLLLLIGCTKDNTDYMGMPEPFVKYLKPSDIFCCITCFMPDLHNCNSFVITDEASYLQFVNPLRIYPYNPSINCDTASLAPIDFNQYSLLGVLTTYGACDSISHSVWINPMTKVIDYNISITRSSGACVDMLIINYNFALIPKIPHGYQVVFNVKSN